MSEEMEPLKPCRSHGPDGQACTLPRGHKSGWQDVHSANGIQWTGGVRTPALSYREDSGHMSEADHQTWGRL